MIHLLKNIPLFQYQNPSIKSLQNRESIHIQQEKKMQEQDQERQGIKRRIIDLLPEMAEQIEGMEKKDLQDVLDMIDKENQEPSKSSREVMVQLILKTFPDMSQEVTALDDADIEEIYNQIINGEGDGAEQSNLSEVSEKKKKQLISEGNINVYEMKKTLIDRLPEYRNQIRNLSEQEIKKMFKELQAEDSSTLKNGTNSKSGINGPIGVNEVNSKKQACKPYEGDADDQEGDSYHFPSSQSQQNPNHNIFPRKRGRPKKYPQPFEEPNKGTERHGNKGYDFTDYNNPNYSNAADVFYNQDFSNFDQQSNISSIKPPKRYNSNHEMIGDPIQYSTAKPIQINVPHKPTHVSLYGSKNVKKIIPTFQRKQHKMAQKELSYRQNAKIAKKQKHKCKITICLDSSDFQSSQSLRQEEEQKVERMEKKRQNMQKKGKRGNGLIKIISGLSKALYRCEKAFLGGTKEKSEKINVQFQDEDQ